ncbi:MAG TPA: aminotransferase class III-fold pyridoxal phosphate-dependent enzyme [Thermoleophilaceae bacterium]|nr:aminotransferase class III-fold pyridoxal phosphate-dependent enzyme [Thermoleophilaceae bacterium]
MAEELDQPQPRPVPDLVEIGRRQLATAAADRTELVEVYRQHVGKGRAALAEYLAAPVEIAASGAHVLCSDGRTYLDCGGYGVFILGHCHPTVVYTVAEQLFTNPMSTRVLLEPRLAEAAEALSAVTPPGLDYAHFVNSGAEAVEVGIKLARCAGKRTLVSMQRGYHGKTLGALSATANEKYQNPFRPLLLAHHVTYGDPAALEEVLQRHDDCAVIVEPVQGEGGVIIPPEGYLSEVERLCREYGAFLIVDEIQTGLGRLGTWWGIDPEGIRPDVMLVGKGLSGGVVPVAATVCTEEAYGAINRDPMLQSATFAGSPVAMSAAIAALAAIGEERIVDRARELGEKLLAAVREVVENECPELVVEVRGRGLLIGIELVRPDLVGEFTLELLARDVIVNHSLNAHAVLRLTPPAVMTDADVDQLVEALTGAARAIRAAESPVQHDSEGGAECQRSASKDESRTETTTRSSNGSRTSSVTRASPAPSGPYA